MEAGAFVQTGCKNDLNLFGAVDLCQIHKEKLHEMDNYCTVSKVRDRGSHFTAIQRVGLKTISSIPQISHLRCLWYPNVGDKDSSQLKMTAAMFDGTKIK